MYRYFHVSTECLSNTWNTKDIEAYLLNREDFNNDRLGAFTHNSIFLSVQLMLVKDHNSWSSNDYNNDETNYVSIVTSHVVETVAMQFLQNFETFIGRQIIEETDTD